MRRKCTKPDRHQIDTPTAQNCCPHRQFFHAVGKEKRGERGEKRGKEKKEEGERGEKKGEREKGRREEERVGRKKRVEGRDRCSIVDNIAKFK